MAQAELTGNASLGPPRAEQAPSRAKVPLAVALVGGIVMLVVVAVGSALLISLRSAGENTFSLLRDRADIALELLETRIRGQLDPVSAAAVSLASMIERGELDPTNRRDMMTVFSGALSGLSQAGGVTYVGRDGAVLQYTRDTKAVLSKPPKSMRLGEIQRRLDELGQSAEPVWLPPIWGGRIGEPILTVAAPVRTDGRVSAGIVFGIGLGRLADFLTTMDAEDKVRAFVLYDDAQVLLHPALVEAARRTGISDGEPLPGLQDFDDPGLSLLLADEKEVIQLAPRIVAYEGRETFVLTRSITGYGLAPWRIGLTLPEADATAEVRRLWMTVGAGVLILLLSVVAALAFGKHITWQVKQLTDAASRLEALDLARAPVVPDSRIRELSHAGAAFNAMTGALKQFEMYVPKSLVLRLMRRGGPSAAGSQLRDVTVMFTDIRGFSAMAERLSADETADFLNRHFSILSACIEAEDGTVDKFVGDGVMAFWGAPDRTDDHAARALRAAAAIAKAMVRENAERAAHRQEEALQVRIGLHSGPAVVGNIGTETRVNYTLVGDTVNTAAHLQALGRMFGDDARCVVLYSAITHERAGVGAAGSPIGSHQLKGRAGQVEVYKLEA